MNIQDDVLLMNVREGIVKHSMTHEQIVHLLKDRWTREQITRAYTTIQEEELQL